jgi:hypothetical protein
MIQHFVTRTNTTAHITNKVKVTDTRSVFYFRDAIMHTLAARRRGDVILPIALHLLPSHSPSTR